MTDITQKRIDSMTRLRQNKKLQKLLGIIVSDILQETSEVAQPLYYNGQWQFYFTYAFEGSRELVIKYMQARLEARGLQLHECPTNNNRIWFYMSEEELESYYVMNKLV